ncbi:hypothetical protein TMO_b0536 (plasmid) [Tistrella mobilis KA081020-065]|uniref:EamA domain-containing protein n=2 Tax=Tistrella mobilis TaxID=171437 RepID=I3TUV6_TISMK|nr:hypothetical protein TMO_b0536 [Tistrella mobilis KA081020-065]
MGAVVLLILILATGQPVVLPEGMTSWAALIYLAVIGSVAGFTTYLLLVQKIGSARAGYATVVFPMVALLISTLFEGYQWTWTAAAGLCLIVFGNIVMFARRPNGSSSHPARQKPR